MRWPRRRRSTTGLPRSAIRAARGWAWSCRNAATPWEIGKGRVLREGSRVALLALGPRLADCLTAADELAARGFPTTVADARFMKPLDTALINQLARHHEVLVTIEDGAAGGFGAAVAHHLAWSGAFDSGLKFRPMTLPDRLVDHNTPAGQLIDAGLTTHDIVQHVMMALGSESLQDLAAIPAQ